MASIVEVAQGKVIRLVSDDLEAVLSIAKAADGRRLVLVTVAFTARAFPGDLILLMSFGALMLAGLFFKGDCFMITGDFLGESSQSKRATTK